MHVEKLERTVSVEGRRRRWVNNIKMKLKVEECDDMDCVHVTQGKFPCATCPFLMGYFKALSVSRLIIDV
jgi:hypothetical protein